MSENVRFEIVRAIDIASRYTGSSRGPLVALPYEALIYEITCLLERRDERTRLLETAKDHVVEERNTALERAHSVYVQLQAARRLLLGSCFGSILCRDPYSVDFRCHDDRCRAGDAMREIEDSSDAFILEG